MALVPIPMLENPISKHYFCRPLFVSPEGPVICEHMGGTSLTSPMPTKVACNETLSGCAAAATPSPLLSES